MRKLILSAIAIAFASACSGKLAAPIAGSALSTAPKAGVMSLAGVKQAFRTYYTDVFQRMDANKDGFLVPSEVPNLQPVDFQKIDTDKDGKLSLKEDTTFWMKRNADFIATAFRQYATDAMKRYDTDKDGVMSFAEFRAVTAGMDSLVQQKYLWAFKASDKRQDGKLTLSELEDFIAWDYVLMGMVINPPMPSAIPVTPSPAQPTALPSTPGPVEPTAAPTAIPSTPDH